MKKFICQLIMLFCLMLLVGCVELDNGEITVENYNIELELNEFAFLNPTYNGNVVFIFVSSDESIFEVDHYGIIYPKSIGEGFVTISLEDNSKSIIVDVKVIGVVLSFENDSYLIQENETIQLLLLADNIPYQGNITWSSSNEIIASVENGLVTANAVGSATITASIGLQSTTVVILIEEEDKEITSLTITTPSSLEIERTTKLRVIANVNVEFEVVWLIDNEDIATICSESGVLFAFEVGTIQVTVYLKDNPAISATKTINLITPVLVLEANPEPSLVIGTRDYKIIVRNSFGVYISYVNCQFTSSNPNIATVDHNGVITTFDIGSTIITATSGSGIGSIVITVLEPPLENKRNTIVEIAIGEFGYVEGQGNNTKYGIWYGLNMEPWCAMFVSWSADQAGIPTHIIPKYASVALGMEWFKSKGADFFKTYQQTQTGEYIPIAGDIIFFKSEGASHTGIVIKVVGELLYTIEGNTSNRVAIRSYYYKHYSKITGYGVPDYPSSISVIKDFDVSRSTPGVGLPTT